MVSNSRVSLSLGRSVKNKAATCGDTNVAFARDGSQSGSNRTPYAQWGT